MQRLVQDRFEHLGATLQAILEVIHLMPPGVVRQGELYSSAAPVGIRKHLDPSCSRSLSQVNAGAAAESSMTRRVVMVTTQDRLNIPPINHFGNW